MEKYGFSDYHGIGDIIGHSKGGYFYDSTTTAQTINWLRCKGQPLNDQHKPWFLAVNLVNPHDVMFIDTDKEGEKVQWRGELDQDDNTLAPTQPPETSFIRQAGRTIRCRQTGINHSMSREDRRRILNTRRRALRWKGSFLMKIVVGVNCLTTISTVSAIVILTLTGY